MKKSKIVQLSGNGTWKEFNKFEVVLENGDKGNYYSIIDSVLSIKVGDIIHYKISDKGTLTVIDPNDIPIPDSQRQLMIVRQSMVKAAVDFYVGGADLLDQDEVIEIADKFVNYVFNGKKK